MAWLSRHRAAVVGAVGVLAALTVIGFLALGGNEPADPELEGPPAAEGRRPLSGFGEVAFTVEGQGGSTSEGCALVADSDAARAQGLMGQRDLRGYDAMVFRNPAPVTNGFYMRNVPMPLTVAWFDADGAYVGAADMAPCPDVEGCPTYPPPAAYTTAVEVLGGGAGRLGIGPGARLRLGGPCR